MHNTSFSPQLTTDQNTDAVAVALAKIARTILVFVLGLSPLLFIPISYAPFSYSKILFLTCGIAAALIFYSLSSLRAGMITVKVSPIIISMWVLAAITTLAAAFSGDMRDSFIGDVVNIHTAVFVILLALVASTVSILSQQKKSILQLFGLFAISGVIIGLYQLLKIILGANVLTFGVFTSVVSNPLGGWMI